MKPEIAKKIDAFFTQFRKRTYKKGEILIRADDEPSGIFYITQGIVKKYAITKKGDEIVVNLFKPISFFPMSWAINNTPNTYYYEALADADVWRAPKEAVLEFVREEPEVLYDLLRRVYKGVDGMTIRMTYLMAGSAYTRLLTELIIHAKRFGKGQNMIEIHLSEKELAAQSGMTRETVSREMQVLKTKRLVLFEKNKLIINSIQKLEEELADSM